MQARLDQAVAARNVAERRLAELVKGPRAQEITEARAALESARSMLETESNEYRARAGPRVSRKLLSQSALDQQRARRDSASGTNKQAAARLNLLLEGTRVEEVEQAEASLKQAQAALVEVQTSAARYVVKAPRAGRVEAIPYKLGERPAAGAPLIVMLADGTPYARVYVPEPLRTKFLPGTRIRVHVDGRDGELTGVVRFVSAEAAFTPYYALTQDDRSRLAYLAEIDLDESAAANVPTGMPVQVELADGESMSARAGKRPGHQRPQPHAALRQAHGRRSRESRYPARDDLRLPRAERLGQVDHDPHAVRAAASERRRVRGARPPGAARSRAAAHEDRLHDPALLAVGRPHGAGEPRFHRAHLRPRRQACAPRASRSGCANTIWKTGASNARER